MSRAEVSEAAPVLERTRRAIAASCAVVLPLFTLVEVNYPRLTPQSRLAIFALLGLSLAFLRKRPRPTRTGLALDLSLVLATFLVCGYVAVQSEPVFSSWWTGGQSLGDRAGIEGRLDVVAGVAGLFLVLEATRRTVGPALPVLSLLFLAYARLGFLLPDWLLPHRGYGAERIVAQTFLHSQGVFGVALRVMFTYVFLFVVFGALLEASGATGYIVDAGRRLFGRSAGGPAKVAVFSSGLLGSLSGSAVANTATTGTFTIPLMRSAGFRPHVAAGVEAAASSGGALVPPVMGAGAYMMLEIIDPPVTYLQIVQAAILPAVLYYVCLFLIVHFQARKLELATVPELEPEGERPRLARYEGAIFLAALGTLVALLLAGFTVFRSVTGALVAVLVLGALRARTRIGPRKLLDSLMRASWSGMPLLGAAACVGIIIGVVTLTGIGSRLPALIVPLAQDHLFSALVAIMISSIVLGMGLPSAICYLLLATLIGPVLGRLGVPALAAHLFIFYFGLMSMVTPPVALAAYAASSIAGSGFLRSSFAAFRFALVGFALPFLFVFRPELLMLAPDGAPAGAGRVALATLIALAGILSLAAATAGYLRAPLSPAARATLLLAAFLTLYPGGTLLGSISPLNLLGIALTVAVALSPGQIRSGRSAP